MEDYESEVKKIIKVWLVALPSLTYCYFIASKIPKVKFLRLFSLIPVFFIFFTLPLFLSSVFPIGLTALFLSWLANFKLLLFAFDQGPLSGSDPPPSLLSFIVKACLPIKINEDKTYPSGQTPQNSTQNLKNKPPKLGIGWPVKALLLAVFIVLHDYRDQTPPNAVLLLRCSLVYLLVDFVFGICSGVVFIVLDVELQPPSDEPFFATSLQDFWGRRWNLMITNLLRHTVYKPIRSCLGSSWWAPVPAMFVTFLVSGLMHELLYYYVTRVTPTWEVTAFFGLHGACVAAEVVVKRYFTGRWQLPWVVSTPVTVSFVMVTGYWLFFPPVVRTGAMARAIDECKLCLDFVKSLVLIKI